MPVSETVGAKRTSCIVIAIIIIIVITIVINTSTMCCLEVSKT